MKVKIRYNGGRIGTSRSEGGVDVAKQEVKVIVRHLDCVDTKNIFY